MQEEKGLKKKMGFWQIWALGVGAVVGDGMFLLVASGAQNAVPCMYHIIYYCRTYSYVYLHDCL